MREYVKIPTFYVCEGVSNKKGDICASFSYSSTVLEGPEQSDTTSHEYSGSDQAVIKNNSGDKRTAPPKRKGSAEGKKGDNADSRKIVPEEMYDEPPETFPLTRGAKDITGLRRGSLTAVGYLRKSRKRGAVWLCKCDCGKYVVRRGLNFYNNKDDYDACTYCRHQTKDNNRAKRERAAKRAAAAEPKKHRPRRRVRIKIGD